MKVFVVSDIHGSDYYAEKIKEINEKEKPDKIVLLGDLYYHGPRNPLTKEYGPMKVAGILNDLQEKIIAVRGNCDAQVDEMISDFKMKDFISMEINGSRYFFTHGHIYNIDDLPPEDFDVMIYGHIHTGFIEKRNGKIFVNTGSISLPKNNTKHSYIMIEENKIYLKDVEGNVLDSIEIKQ